MLKKYTVLFLLAVALLLSACDMNQAAGRVGLELKKVNIKNFSNKGFGAVIYLKVYNPNWFGLTVSDLRYQVLVGGQELARGAITGEISVPGDGSVVAELPLDVSFAALKGKVPDLLKIRSDYQVRGEVAFRTWYGHYTIPFDTKKDIGAP